MIDFGNHYCVAQIWVLSLGTCCPPREQRLLVSCSPIPHHVIPEGPLEEHGRNFWRGDSKFSQLSIFSELNNLKILTLKDEYSSCCGITKSELTQYFREGIEEMAEHNGLTYEETLQQLKQHYDGYHFSINSEDIFNPYSIINALDDKELNSYWFTIWYAYVPDRTDAAEEFGYAQSGRSVDTGITF